jgi:hypothetical protein
MEAASEALLCVSTCSPCLRHAIITSDEQGKICVGAEYICQTLSRGHGGQGRKEDALEMHCGTVAKTFVEKSERAEMS